jgi:SAM-dependent methyltransferase
VTEIRHPCFEADYYERNYRSYARQNPPKKMTFYRRLLEQARAASNMGEPPRVLDIGCAFGTFLSSLDSSWCRSGCDPSGYAIARARERINGVRFKVGALPEVPFDGPFDVVTAFDVLEHVPDLEAAREAIWNLLSPGGWLVFAVPVYDGPTGPIVRLLDGDQTHVHKRARGFWLDWVREGFEPLSWYGVYRFFLPGLRRYLHVPTTHLRRFTPSITVVVRKR